MWGGAGPLPFGAGPPLLGAGPFFRRGPAPQESVSWRFAVQVPPPKSDLRQGGAGSKLLFDSAELSKFTADERAKYQLEMTTERDIHNQIVYARDKGLEEGLEQGRAEGRAEGAREQAVESARYFLRLGLTNEDVSKGTGLTVEEVEALRKGD